MQAITRRRNHLNVGVTRQAHRLHAEGYRPSLTGLIERDIQVHIRYLPCRIRKLEEEGIAMVLSVPELSEKFHHLLSIPGIAQTSAPRLIAELRNGLLQLAPCLFPY